MAALALVAAVAGCSGTEAPALPARVAPAPDGVRGLGPAVLAAPVADQRRDDLTGLFAVDTFGADLPGPTPVRRHVEVAVGDPRFPTVARGLAEDPRDALVVDGRLRDVTLPDHVAARQAAGVGAGLTITGSRCVVVAGDGAVVQPATEASCDAAELGGAYWTDQRAGRYGGINLTTGRASPAVALPAYPIAASADGRMLAAVTTERPRQLVVADTSTGRRHTGVTVTRVSGAFTAGGFALTHVVDNRRRISVVTPEGVVRTFPATVGTVAFAADGRRALIEDARRLAVLDLEKGSVTPVAGLPPMAGAVTAIAAGDTALAVELPFAPDAATPPVRATSAWSVRLSSATATAVPGAPAASAVRVAEAEAGPAAAEAVPALSFQPGGESMTLTREGRIAAVPPGAAPGKALGDGAVLHGLADSRILITDGTGGRTEVATGAGPDQRLGPVVPTPDGAHLVISLRAARPGSQPGPLDEVVVTRRDGTGTPVVVYRGVILVGLSVPER